MKRNKVNEIFRKYANEIKFATVVDDVETDTTYTKQIKPFSPILMDFIEDFSKKILSDPSFKRFPEVISLAFWMRKSHIKKLASQLYERNKTRLVTSRGIALHFAPANVDTIFIYSLFISLLIGNKNIVRVSKNKSEQQLLIVSAINSILNNEKYITLRAYIVILNYPHNDHISAELSSICDIRIIWGGDETVKKISNFPLPPKAIDIKFANKYSFALIGASEVMQSSNEKLKTLAKNFVNDSYWFGQMGCSSPRNVYWIGSKNDIEHAQRTFWREVSNQVDDFPHSLTDADFINKYVSQCDFAATNHIKNSSNSNMLTARIVNGSSNLFGQQTEHCGGGLFFEDSLGSLEELGQIIDRNTQTITYAGVKKESTRSAMSGWSTLPDRVVPFGEALNFDLVWDGYDLLESFGRFVVVK